MLLWLTIINIVLILILIYLTCTNKNLKHRNLLWGLIILQIILLIINILLQIMG